MNMNSQWSFFDWRCKNCDWKTVRGARAFVPLEVTQNGVPDASPGPCRDCGQLMKIVLDRRKS